MIDLTNIKLTQLLLRRENINENIFTRQEVNESISKYVYPSAILPLGMLEKNSMLYKGYSVEQNFNYLLSFCSYLFEDMYSLGELQIITLYCILRITENIILNPKTIEYITNALQISSDKLDIQYYLEEIKYKYLIHLTTENNINNQTLIKQLLEELEAIKEAHNNFNVVQRVSIT